MCLIGKKIIWLFVFLMLQGNYHVRQPFKIFTSPYTILIFTFQQILQIRVVLKYLSALVKQRFLLYFYKFFIRLGVNEMS